jgi:hypothetical protein
MRIVKFPVVVIDCAEATEEPPSVAVTRVTRRRRLSMSIRSILERRNVVARRPLKRRPTRPTHNRFGAPPPLSGSGTG